MAKPKNLRERYKSANKRFDLTITRAKREIAAVEKALLEGFPAKQVRGSRATKSAVRKASEDLGENRNSFLSRLGTPDTPGTWKAVHGIEPDWAIKPKVSARGPKSPIKLWASAKAVRRYLLTAAQDETSIHLPFWKNLQAYAAHIDAEIMIAPFTYQRGLYSDHSVRTGVFASELIPFIRAEIFELGPKIVWYGAANILPTATDPLSGWETATRDKWGIYGHAKIALKSIPVMPGAFGKQIMTTGVATVPNYVQRNAGQKAIFHHSYGATLVEVATDGIHFCRQIGANAKDGSFQDLDALVRDGMVFPGNRVEAVTWGDVHRELLDGEVALGSWGFDLNRDECTSSSDSMLDVLQPATTFYHDSYNFTARSHHTRHDPHERVMRRAEGKDSVEDEIKITAKFLAAIRRPWTKTVHIDSNHNRHLHRWLKDDTGFRDSVNAAYWCELNAATLRAAERGDDFLIHEHALRRASVDGLKGVVFLKAGQSYVVCRGTAPIECGLHGDIGPRGARGSAVAMARVVERINAAHTHEPCIREAAYYAGTSSLLDMKFNTTGPGAWHHAHTVVYPSGRRTIITMQGARWRA